MKVRLERTPIRRGGRLSLWGLCLASAELLLVVEGQMLVSFLLRASLQGFVFGRRKEMEAGSILNHTAGIGGL